MMRRWIGNHLILLAYHIEPQLKTELDQWLLNVLTQQAQTAATQATHALLQHQQAVAHIAAQQ
jgi:hypothetical protein